MPQQRRAAAAAKKPRMKAGSSIRPVEPAAALVDIADTLCNVASASCTVHTKHAELVRRAAPSAEQKHALSSVRSSDEILDEAVDLYEVACLEDSNHDEVWWHKANMVWRAAKEYLRHVVSSNHLTRGGSEHGRAELVGLSIEYELEASALLHLRHSIESYRAARPGAA